MENPPKSEFARQDRPPALGRVIPLIRFSPKGVKTFAVLFTSLYGTYCHWSFLGPKGRHIKCVKDKRKCFGCRKELPRKWAGFLGVSSVQGVGVGLLQLTPKAGDEFLELVKERVDCRGMIIAVQREYEDIRAPLKIEHIGEYSSAAPLPPAFDPEPTLNRLWSTTGDD